LLAVALTVLAAVALAAWAWAARAPRPRAPVSQPKAVLLYAILMGSIYLLFAYASPSAVTTGGLLTFVILCGIIAFLMAQRRPRRR
jgi:hypothetical protein